MILDDNGDCKSEKKDGAIKSATERRNESNETGTPENCRQKTEQAGNRLGNLLEKKWEIATAGLILGLQSGQYEAANLH